MGSALLSGMYAATEASLRDVMEGGSVGHWELQAAALLKWGKRLASLLTHSFFSLVKF